MTETNKIGQGLRAWRMIQEDSRVARIREITIILLSFIFIVGSLLIWPYVISLSRAGSTGADLTPATQGAGGATDMSALLTLGIVLCILLAVLGFLIYWFDRSYHPLRTFFAMLVVSTVVSLVYTGITGVNFIIIQKGDVVSSILAFIVRSILSCMLAVVPALIFAGITHLMRMIFNYRHEMV